MDRMDGGDPLVTDISVGSGRLGPRCGQGANQKGSYFLSLYKARVCFMKERQTVIVIDRLGLLCGLL